MRNAIIMLLVIAMLALPFGACAEQAVPSITISDVVNVVDTVATASGVEVSEGFLVELTEKSEQAEAVFSEVMNVVQQNKPVVEFFGEEVIANAIAEVKLPVEVKSENLKLDEFFTLNVANYEEVYNDVEVVFEFVTQYKEETTLLAMVGIITADGIVWIPLQAEVIDGQVKVLFTQDVLQKVMVSEAVFSLLRAE